MPVLAAPQQVGIKNTAALPASAYFNWTGAGQGTPSAYNSFTSNINDFSTGALAGGKGAPGQVATNVDAFKSLLSPTDLQSYNDWVAEGKRLKSIDDGYFNAGPAAGLIGPALAFSGAGLPLAALGGAIGGSFTGQGLKGTVLGGLGGAAGAGGGSWLSDVAGFGDLGLSASQGAALGGATIGGVSGGLTSGGLGAATGALSGGLGSYFDSANSTIPQVGTQYADAADSALGGFNTEGFGNLQDFLSQGAGSAASGIASGLGGLGSTAAGTTDMAGKYSNLLTPALSGGIGLYTNNAAKDALIKSQQKNIDLLSPFLNESFNPGDLTQDPGYQFQLKQGEDAIGRQQAAKGNYFSGGALQAAQDYGQGLAGTTYQNAFDRWLSTQGQKLGAAGAIANTNDAIGQARANNYIGSGNVLSGSLASGLKGLGLGDGTYTNGLGQTLGGNTQSDLLTQWLLSQQAAKAK